MSLINNIPFDINRTPVDQNATVKRRGTVPVLQSEAVHATEKEVRIKERRKGHRRKQSKSSKFNQRNSNQRRKSTRTVETKAIPAENAHTSGSIIDLEV